MKQYLHLLLLGICLVGYTQPTPPCGLDYGSGSDESNISLQMRYGTIADAVNAINQGKNSRGTALGCPQIAYSYAIADTTEPTLPVIANLWNNVHAPAISSFSVTCPRIGRYESNAALGAYYAMLAGYYNDSSKLAEIADMMYNQQYAEWNATNPNPRNEGVYAYLNVSSSDPCYPGGVVGSSVNAACTALPAYCITYDGGLFVGESFLTSGQDDANNWFDGGLAYDHGWVGAQMIASAIQQNDPLLKAKYRNSVELAAQYCISEHPVKNHNYTAKLIWLLAQMYDWTGDTTYANELNYKLNKNLIPGILWDATNDGFVDGTNPSISFSSLSSVAQEPGRMWDGHNSLPWYHAMNAWALTEAYVAFRDRGDVQRANELKPYVVAMMDNLANEIINEGVVTPDQLGVRDISYALLTAIWKLSQFENEAHPNWQQAAWAMWNTGYFNSYSTHSVCVGLYLLVKSNTAYIPLHLREDYVLSSQDHGSEDEILLYPNPVEDLLYLKNLADGNMEYSIMLANGKIVLKGNIINGSIDVSSLETGLYLLEIEGRLIGKIIKH
jgi:hypothetical protein